MKKIQKNNYEKEINSLYSLIKNTLLSYKPQADTKRLHTAFQLAKKCHQHQKRESGEPYVLHPLHVAHILTSFHADEDTLISAFLHDAVEDTDVNKEEIKKLFGEKVAYLVDSVTAIDLMFYQGTKIQGDMETIRKILRKGQRDIRVIMIKLADRVHNMRTLNGKKDEMKRIKKAKETMEVFVAIAARLGVWKIKRELETLSFEILNPEETKCIKSFLKKTSKKRERIYQKIIDQLKKGDTKKIVTNVQPYERGLFAFKKVMDRKKRKKPLLNDSFVLQIVTKDVDSCYLVLGIIHKLWKNLSRHEEDFISNPRDNGYQAFHTNIVTKDGNIVQCRIMTEDMQKRHWYGIAYEKFREDAKGKDFLLPLKLIDRFTKNKPEEFYAAAKTDLFGEKIEIHIDGKSIKMPINSSALDAVFANNSEKATFTKKIYINDELVALNQALSDGDYIRALFTSKPTLQYDWLFQTKTTYAKLEVRKHLEKLSIEEKISLGKMVLQREFDLHGKGNFMNFLRKHEDFILKHLNIPSINILFVSIGEGSMNPFDVFKSIIKKNERGFWADIIRTIGIDNQKQHQLHLKIQGIRSNRVNPLPKISEVSESFDVPIRKSVLYEKNKTFTIWVIFCANKSHDFHNLFTYIKNIPGVTNAEIQFSIQNMKKFLYWSLAAIVMSALGYLFYHWQFTFAFIYSNSLLYVLYGLIISLSFLPIMFVNILSFEFVKNYFAQIRQNIWIPFLSIILNILTFFAFTSHSLLLTKIHLSLILCVFIRWLICTLIQYYKLVSRLVFSKIPR